MRRRRVTAQFRDGDPEAVRTIYRDYGRLVFAVAHRILRNRSLAEEATQRTFLQAWRAADSFDADRELGPWLASIARRAAIDVSRREAVRAAEPLGSAPSGDPALISRPDSAQTIYEIWAVRQAVAELPAEEREVARLQHLGELTHVEIAERLGVPIATVKSRSFRAHQRLAALLGHLRE
jgi:RNA polymerase sigma factor (sigma-70 family)